MDVFKNFKETNPQRHYLKIMCRLAYYMGIGDCWYEKIKRSKTHKTFYAIWAVFINSYLILWTVNELLANFRSDLTAKEKGDLVRFSFAHPSLCSKCIFLMLRKKKVRVLFKRLVGDETVFTSLEIEKKSVKEVALYILCLILSTYCTLIFTAIDSIKAYVNEGVPYRTEVGILPSPSYSGYLYGILNVFKESHWWVIVTNMCLVDGLVFCSLVFLGYKFRLVGMYFKSLRKKVLENAENKSKKDLAEEFEKDFLVGIKLHEDALWCARKLQEAVGSIYGVHVVETTTLLAICLLNLVGSERNLTFLLANLFFIFCMLTLNGIYMMAAGDITYEASQLSESMFQSGWELVQTSPGFRSLAVVAIQRSQWPVCMTAFGVIELSHRNLITVMRSSYSFFAVMY